MTDIYDINPFDDGVIEHYTQFDRDQIIKSKAPLKNYFANYPAKVGTEVYYENHQEKTGQFIVKMFKANLKFGARATKPFNKSQLTFMTLPKALIKLR